MSLPNSSYCHRFPGQRLVWVLLQPPPLLLLLMGGTLAESVTTAWPMQEWGVVGPQGGRKLQ